MSKIYDFIKYFIDKDKVLSDDLFINDSAEIFYDGHDAIEKLEEVRRWYVESGCGYDVDGRSFEVGKVNTLDVEDGLAISFG